jgi:hypothetical protein
MAAGELADLDRHDAKLKVMKAELKAAVLASGSNLMDIHGIGPAGAARILAGVGDVARFPTATTSPPRPAPRPSMPPAASTPAKRQISAFADDQLCAFLYELPGSPPTRTLQVALTEPPLCAVGQRVTAAVMGADQVICAFCGGRERAARAWRDGNVSPPCRQRIRLQLVFGDLITNTDEPPEIRFRTCGRVLAPPQAVRYLFPSRLGPIRPL